MEKLKFYEKNLITEEDTVYRVEYSLLIQPAGQGKCFGVSIQKTDEAGNIEKDDAEGLCESRKEVEEFLFRLAEGNALPAELVYLCDDFISEKESAKSMNEMVS